MAGWRLWRKDASIGEPSPEILESINTSADDGFAMARLGAIMAIKNKILVQAITQPDAFDASIYLAPAREVITTLAVESLETASIVSADLKRARKLRGEALSRNDYRRGDVNNLTIRLGSLEQVAQRLKDKLQDEQWLRVLITEAHGLAWAELSREMERNLDRKEVSEFGDENYEQERSDRLRQFINLDLAKLIEEQTPEY
ncbi:hypothetical protein [Aurantimicrobium sp. MWH-Uga1]|uniref:hypothetical protein n=1 Tax=Aurantimicrobium sp. MWH-Uga1 TaxID=2079575 RepID=UPI000DEDA6C5|nr:hypothetical protein [Aurantimicrobium sp. MWH-Uga1]AXE55237.1 hypothetical protein AURUGA1_01568 [Aurantimicrobium sp. MWH-Uga1]